MELKPSTLDSYTEILHRRILDVKGEAAKLRAIRLSELQRRDIAQWWDAINQQFGHQRYNKSAFTRLRTALTAAVNRNLITSNPAASFQAPAPKPKRKELPSADDLHKVVSFLSEPKKIIGVLTFFHSMRIGEVLGLRRSDIHDDGQQITIHISGNAYKIRGQGMIRQDSPKSDTGNRIVPIFPTFHPLIRSHLKRFVGTSPHAWVCATGMGSITLDTSYRESLKHAARRAGFEGSLSPHYGRVWLITTLAEQGMPIPAIGEILGQRDLRTITEIYMRASEVKRQEVLDRVDGAFGTF